MSFPETEVRVFVVHIDFRCHGVVGFTAGGEAPVMNKSATAVVQHDDPHAATEMLIRLHRDLPGFHLTGTSAKETPFRPGAYGIMEIV